MTSDYDKKDADVPRRNSISVRIQRITKLLLVSVLTVGTLVYVYRLWGVGTGYLLYGDVYGWAAQNSLIAIKKQKLKEILGLMGEGCSQLLLEECVGLSITYDLFHDSEAMAQIVDAIRNPCRYIVDPMGGPEGFRPFDSDWQAQSMNKRAWEQGKCASGPINVKVVLNIVDENNAIILRLVKPAG